MRQKVISMLIAIVMVIGIVPFGVMADGEAAPVYPDGVSTASFTGGNTIYWNGNYYSTLISAIEAVETANTSATLYCKEDANVGAMTHGDIKNDLTIYGNNAFISSGERYQNKCPLRFLSVLGGIRLP